MFTPHSASGPLYSPREIARATGVPESQVLAALGGAHRDVSHEEAVWIGRALLAARDAAPSEGAALAAAAAGPSPIFSIFTTGRDQKRVAGLPLALSGTLHAGFFVAVVLVTTFWMAPSGATLAAARPESMPLVFLSLPGPGGGGGGGGLMEKAPPPKAESEGRHKLSSPLPPHEPPKPIEATPKPPEPLKAEPLPILVAPVVALPADTISRVGVLEQTTAKVDSHGPGTGAGTGAGAGTGVGEGDGPGLGPGSGGGTGGGPYRPGSGIEPPKLLREVKPDYTEDARLQRITGEVVLEIVIRRDGSVGDVTVRRGLGGGLNDRAVQAVRQWRFSPARRQGAPVDVIVEVAVEFKLR